MSKERMLKSSEDITILLRIKNVQLEMAKGGNAFVDAGRGDSTHCHLRLCSS